MTTFTSFRSFYKEYSVEAEVARFSETRRANRRAAHEAVKKAIISAPSKEHGYYNEIQDALTRAIPEVSDDELWSQEVKRLFK